MQRSDRLKGYLS